MAPAVNDQTSVADSLPQQTDVEKDEFGRDIRPVSPKSAGTPSSSNDAANTQPLPVEQVAQTVPTELTSVQKLDMPGPANEQPPDAQVVPSESPVATLEEFDIRSFDLTAAQSWEALGKMWQASYGHVPSQEQLMQFVYASSAAVAGTVVGQVADQTWSNTDWSDMSSGVGRGSSWRGGRGSRSFSRRGGEDSGRSQESWDAAYGATTSDAIVLGCGSEDSPPNSSVASVSQPEQETSTAGAAHTSGGVGGKMQRVGDKWMFVRETVGGVP
jgi:protein NRD1